MHESRRMSEDQDLVRLRRFRGGLRRKRRLHLLDVGCARYLRVAAAAAAGIALRLRRGRRRRQRRGYRRCELRSRHGTGICRIRRRVPLIESTFEFVAADGAILITVGDGEKRRPDCATATTATPAGSRGLGRCLLRRSADDRRKHRTADDCFSHCSRGPTPARSRSATSRLARAAGACRTPESHRSSSTVTGRHWALETGNWKLTSITSTDSIYASNVVRRLPGDNGVVNMPKVIL